MKGLTFVNYDASHRQTTLRDLKLINRHVNTHVSKQALVNKKREKKKSSACCCTSDHLEPCVLDLQIGGLRTEPFGILPIEYSGCVPEAFDYCKFFSKLDTNVIILRRSDTQIYAPLVLRTGNFQGKLQARKVMANVLASPMFCEAIIAMMLMMRNLGLDRSKRMSSAILFHTNNVVSRVRECLSLPGAMYSDLVLMSICAIAMVNVCVASIAASLETTNQLSAFSR